MANYGNHKNDRLTGNYLAIIVCQKVKCWTGEGCIKEFFFLQVTALEHSKNVARR